MNYTICDADDGGIVGEPEPCCHVTVMRRLYKDKHAKLLM